MGFEEGVVHAGKVGVDFAGVMQSLSSFNARMDGEGAKMDCWVDRGGGDGIGEYASCYSHVDDVEVSFSL